MTGYTIKSVRLIVDGTAHELTYDANANRWSGDFAAPLVSSVKQPGQKYNAQLEITNIADVTNVYDMNDFPQLGLRVKEKTPPTVEIHWPPDGHYTQEFNDVAIFRLRDDFSGIDPGTITVLLDGTPVSFIFRDEPGGYDVFFRFDGLPDGAHTLSVYAYDFDDNKSNTAEITFYLYTDRNLKTDWTKYDYMNAEDLTRIENYTKWIGEFLTYYGFYNTNVYKTWEEDGEPKRVADIDRIRRNIDNLRTGLVPWREILYNNNVDYKQVNVWEWDLQQLLAWLKKIISALFYSAELRSGEV